VHILLRLIALCILFVKPGLYGAVGKPVDKSLNRNYTFLNKAFGKNKLTPPHIAPKILVALFSYFCPNA